MSSSPAKSGRARSIDDTNILDNVKEYYGRKLSGSEDLKTDACALNKQKMPKHVREALALVNEEVTSRYYGCGLVASELLQGCHVLDLGSGSGQDCFVLSKLVGPKGHVTGLDMTDEQLDVAKQNIQYHMDVFGYSEPNVDFVKGYIDELGEAGLQDDTFDVIISNCVVNLSPDKMAALTEAHRVLKTGGEMYFSDMYADREVPEEIRQNEDLWGEGLGGALYWKTLVSLAAEIGFSRPRLVTSRFMQIASDEIQELVGDIKYVAGTYRLFKIPEKRSKACNVVYDGGIAGCEEAVQLDHNTRFTKGESVSVDDEVASILEVSRFKNHFRFEPSTPCQQSGATCQAKDEVDPFLYARLSKSSCFVKQPNKCS